MAIVQGKMVGETVKGSTLVQMGSVPILLYDQVRNGKRNIPQKSIYLLNKCEQSCSSCHASHTSKDLRVQSCSP